MTFRKLENKILLCAFNKYRQYNNPNAHKQLALQIVPLPVRNLLPVRPTLVHQWYVLGRADFDKQEGGNHLLGGRGPCDSGPDDVHDHVHLRELPLQLDTRCQGHSQGSHHRIGGHCAWSRHTQPLRFELQVCPGGTVFLCDRAALPAECARQNCHFLV